MHRIYLAFFLAILAACGSKSEISTSGEAVTGLVTDQGQRLADTVSSPGRRQRIACESFRSIDFTHSWSNREDRLSHSLGFVEGESVAPVLLSATKTRADVLHLERTYYPQAELQVYLSEYSFFERRERKRIKLLKAPRVAQEELYRQLGLGYPKLAARSPDGFLFAVRDAEGYSVRRSASPLEQVKRWDDVDFVNPRWTQVPGEKKEMVFADLDDGGRISQVIVRLDEEAAITVMEKLPAPVLHEKAHQLGLRFFSPTQVLWLEWADGKVLFRLMDLVSRRTFELPLPDDLSFGSGFALHVLENGARTFVLQTRGDLRFYRLDRGNLVRISVLPYPKTALDRIAGDPYWRPGQIFDDGREEQLFLVLPEQWGTQLLAVDKAESFRRFGYIRCMNPDFLEEK